MTYIAQQLPSRSNLDRTSLLVSVVCPMYNEGSRISESLNRLFESLESLGSQWEVILVNDGSTDGSLESASKLLSMEENFKIVSYEVNRGRGYALRRGLQQATGEIVVTTEADLSWGYDISQKLVHKLLSGAFDAVVASPHCHGGSLVNVPLSRRLYTKLGNRMLRTLMPTKLTMYTGMTRAYWKEVIQSLDLECDDKDLHLEIVVKLAALGYRIGEIPAVLAWPPDRPVRRSSFRARKYIASHLLFGIRQAPFLLLATVSAFLCLLGLSTGLYLLCISFYGTPVAGRPLLSFAGLSITMGAFVFLFGVIAEQNKQLERRLFRVQHQMLRGIVERSISN